MQLRLAQLSDIPACGALDSGYLTDYSWQVVEERPLRSGQTELSITLRTVRLPRPRAVRADDLSDQLEAEWPSVDLFLVAEDDGLAGYICASVVRRHAWVNHLVIARPYRRQGLATRLLSATSEWAVQNRLRSLLAAAPIKNYPAVSLFMARGYRICGYNERHFSDDEVALYLARDLQDE